MIAGAPGLPRARVIGIGQAAAGDDGVGEQVVRALQAAAAGASAGRAGEDPHAGGELVDVELLPRVDPSALIELLASPVGCRTILVDAVLAAPPGLDLELSLDQLASLPPRWSSHGLGVAQVVGLARALHGASLPELRVVAVSIAPPARYQVGLSAEVAAAVPRAVARVLALLAPPAPPAPLAPPIADRMAGQ